MTSRTSFLTLICLTTALPPVIYGSAAPIQDLNAVIATAEAAVARLGTGIRAKAEPLDPRLRLSACARGLTATLPAAPKGPRLTLKVACESGAPWSVWVPVRVETDAEVVVARRALSPGTLLGSEDVAVVRRRIPGFIDCCATDPAHLLGQRVRRPIAADAPIPLEHIEAPPVIRRGEQVTVIAGAPGFEVRSAGTALADAREGDAVRIRHATSLRVIHARADSRGVVRAD